MTKIHHIDDLARILSIVDNTQFIGVFQQYLEYADRTVNSEGKQAIVRLKAYKDRAMKAVSTGDFSIPRGKFRQLRPILKILQNLLESNDVDRMYAVFTVLRCYDLYYPSEKQVKLAFEEFENEYLTGKHSYFDPEDFPSNDFGEFLQLVGPSIRNGMKLAKPKEKALLLTKKGTVSYNDGNVFKTLPSIAGASFEYDYIARKVPGYKDAIGRFADRFGKPHGLVFSSTWPKVVDGTKDNNYTVSLRRNVAFGAPGGKVRVIGIADYPTQYSLQPLHDTLMATLGNIPSDYTSDHSIGFEKLNSITNTRSKQSINCYDLTAATDRFPIKVQQIVLTELFGKETSDDWSLIMTGIPFRKKFYKYGQPMGMLSSWATFALTHHLMVHFAIYNVYGRQFSLYDDLSGIYGIVGDDVFIVSDAIAKEYAKLMSSLGVAINYSKSLVADDRRSVTEFVKRNSLDGIEISGLSPTNILRAYNGDYSALTSVLRLVRDRNIFVDVDKFIADVRSKTRSEILKSWIDANSGIPLDIGGLWIENRSTTPLASPENLLVSMASYGQAASKFVFRGKLMNSNGKFVIDDVNYWQSTIPISDIRNTPLGEYERKYGENHDLLKAELKSRIWNILDQLNTDLRWSPVYNTELYHQFLNLIKESDGNEFYQRKEINQHIDKDYIHKRQRLFNAYIFKGMDGLVNYFLKAPKRSLDYDLYAELFASVPEDCSPPEPERLLPEQPDLSTDESVDLSELDFEQLDSEFDLLSSSNCTFDSRDTRELKGSNTLDTNNPNSAIDTDIDIDDLDLK